MPANAVAENVLGTLGAICWSVQLIPQVYKSYKLKNTAGLSSWMLAIWFAGGIFLGAYVVVQGLNIPLIVQPQCFTFLAAICWAQCLYYDKCTTKRFAITSAAVAIVGAAGLEAALIFGARAAESHGNGRVAKMCGIVSAILIACGLIPQYIEIFRFKAVVGISLIFLSVDLFGGVFSLLSLVFAEGAFDTIASLSYGIVVVLEIGVFFLAAILNPAHNRREAARRQADDEALSGMRSISQTRSVSSQATIALPEPQRAEVNRGRSQVPRTPLGWLDDAVTPAPGIDAVKRPDSVERELSHERYQLKRVAARWDSPSASPSGSRSSSPRK